MKTKTPIVELNATNLDRVTGGCKLAVVGTSSKPLVNRLDSFRDMHATQLETNDFPSAHALSSDLFAADLSEQAVSSLPPMWCGPTNGLDTGHDYGHRDDSADAQQMAPLHLDDQSLAGGDALPMHHDDGHGWASEAPLAVSSAHHADLASEQLAQSGHIFYGGAVSASHFAPDASDGHVDVRDHRSDANSALVRDHRDQ